MFFKTIQCGIFLETQNANIDCFVKMYLLCPLGSVVRQERLVPPKRRLHILMPMVETPVASTPKNIWPPTLRHFDTFRGRITSWVLFANPAAYSSQPLTLPRASTVLDLLPHTKSNLLLMLVLAINNNLVEILPSASLWKSSIEQNSNKRFMMSPRHSIKIQFHQCWSWFKGRYSVNANSSLYTCYTVQLLSWERIHVDLLHRFPQHFAHTFALTLGSILLLSPWIGMVEHPNCDIPRYKPLHSQNCGLWEQCTWIINKVITPTYYQSEKLARCYI